jgi:hypothetical protein
MDCVGRDPPLVTDSDIDAFALQFLNSGYVDDMYANWPLERRLDRFLRQHGLSHLADNGDICKTILDRVMTSISISPCQHIAAECALAIRQEQIGDVIVVLPVGVLDSASYSTLRTALVKAATEQPVAGLVDVDALGDSRQLHHTSAGQRHKRLTSFLFHQHFSVRRHGGRSGV